MLEDYLLLLEGSPDVSYAIYRGLAPGAETLYATGVTDLFFVDAQVVGGVVYYYVIYAETFCGQSPVSNEASAKLSCCTRYTVGPGCDTTYTVSATPSTTYTMPGEPTTVYTIDEC